MKKEIKSEPQSPIKEIMATEASDKKAILKREVSEMMTMKRFRPVKPADNKLGSQQLAEERN